MTIACLIRNTSVLELVRATLKQAGIACAAYPSEALLFRALRRASVDLVLIDFGIAPEPGDSLLSWLNGRSGDHTPVLGLSATRSAQLTALVLNSGADDLLARPFDAVELVARVHALRRRKWRRTVGRMIGLAGFALDRDTGRFADRGTPLELTAREFSMAWMFFSAPGFYFSRETIGSSIWSAGSEVAGRTIAQHVY